MRGRVVLWLSLVLNIVLTAMILELPRLTPEPAAGIQPHSAALEEGPHRYRTNVVVRRQNFVWNQIESEDYRTYIANLRAIGCPEATIRDIIVAEVNQLFSRRRATEVLTADQQWWRSDPDPAVTSAAVEKIRSLENERRTLLTALLGPAWESTYYPYPASPNSPPLDGPILGALPNEVKQAVHDVESRSLQRREAYLSAQAQAGKEPDPAILARLRQETRTELAEILGPAQLEEYVLSYSNNAGQLRSELRGLETSADDFRKLFRACDPIDQELQGLAGNTDPESVKRRRELEQQRAAAIQEALGTEKFQEYRLSQDPIYRQTQAVARQAGAPAEKLMPLYEINQATETERARIRNDGNLSSEEKDEALRAVQTAQLNSLRRLLGEEAYQRYLNSQTR
jgi:hypothetical protein